MVLADILNRISRPVALHAGRSIGSIIGAVAQKQRRAAGRRIAQALEVDAAEADQMARRCAVTICGNLVDAIRLETMSRSQLRELVQLEGIDTLREALHGGRGALIIGAHLGNWELLGAAIADCEVPLSVVGRRPSDPALADRLERLRARWGVETLWRDTGIRPIMRALSSGRAVGILIDQATDVTGAWVSFFGRDAWTPTGPARIALKTQCPVVMAHMADTDDSKYVGRIDSDATCDDAVELTRRWTCAIEDWVRETPHSWVWMHDRWRRIDSVDGKGMSALRRVSA
jgi:Kdo2-lipid IVA lauroyltransferase/acyltransferase